jgi:hypothetical protein
MAAKKKSNLVVVRTYGAGVHVGKLVSQKGQEVVLSDARRLWRWRGANTLNEVAIRGVEQDYTRLSEPVASITLPSAIEIITVAEAARASLTASRWAK